MKVYFGNESGELAGYILDQKMLVFSASPLFALLVMSAIFAVIGYAAYDCSKYED